MAKSDEALIFEAGMKEFLSGKYDKASWYWQLIQKTPDGTPYWHYAQGFLALIDLNTPAAQENWIHGLESWKGIDEIKTQILAALKMTQSIRDLMSSDLEHPANTSNVDD